MAAVLSYHVYTTREGGLWLAEDEKRWTSNFMESAAILDFDLANDIGEREELAADAIYIMACMGTR